MTKLNPTIDKAEFCLSNLKSFIHILYDVDSQRYQLIKKGPLNLLYEIQERVIELIEELENYES